MSRYVVSAEAKTDLGEIWEYIAQDNLDAADRWIARLREAFDSLARAPGIGHKREDLTDFPVLFWPVGEYLVIYRAQTEHVEIVAVTQGARYIPSFLQQRAPW
jgi:plasmid stabilization system protein ParE